MSKFYAPTPPTPKFRPTQFLLIHPKILLIHATHAKYLQTHATYAMHELTQPRHSRYLADSIFVWISEN